MDGPTGAVGSTLFGFGGTLIITLGFLAAAAGSAAADAHVFRSLSE